MQVSFHLNLEALNIDFDLFTEEELLEIYLTVTKYVNIAKAFDDTTYYFNGDMTMAEAMEKF